MKVILIIGLLVFVGLFITIFPNIFGGFETQHNVTVLNNTAEYDAMTTIIQTDMTVIAAIGTLLCLGLLFVFVKVIS